MTISSRTPEGSPNHCPICDTLVCIEPSQPSGDAPCPGCGTLLWYVRTSAGLRAYESEEVTPILERITRIICDHLGVNKDRISSSTSFVEDMGGDSLDIVLLVMALEEECQITIPQEEAEKIKTIGDAIDYIMRHRSK